MTIILCPLYRLTYVCITTYMWLAAFHARVLTIRVQTWCGILCYVVLLLLPCKQCCAAQCSFSLALLMLCVALLNYISITAKLLLRLHGLRGIPSNAISTVTVLSVTITRYRVGATSGVVIIMVSLKVDYALL